MAKKTQARKAPTTRGKKQTKKKGKRSAKRTTTRTRSTKRPTQRQAATGAGGDLFGKVVDWRKLSHDIAGALQAGTEQLGSHVQDLETRASKVTGPARKHLLDAAKSLRKAQQEAQKPIRDELAKGMQSIARTMGLPLGTAARGGGRVSAAPTSPTPRVREGRGKNQAFVLDQLKLAGPSGVKVSDIKQTAKAAGLNETSVGQAVTKLTSEGRIKRVGRGRYAAKD